MALRRSLLLIDTVSLLETFGSLKIRNFGCIYGIPKMHKFSSSDSFPKLRPIVSSIGTFNYNLARFLF